MIECKDVDYILAIAKHQSISLAARELFISQPALTKYLQSLETRIGVVLFDRSKKKLLPTLAVERGISAYAAEMAGVKSLTG
jgi:DNA-binding transcriptional LysR family regulator